MKFVLQSFPVLLLGGILGVVSVRTDAQSSPPPKVLLEAPKSSALSGPYASKEGGFTIAFPATPAVEISESASSFGKTTMKVYSLPTSLAMYSLVYLDFPTAIKDKFDLDTRFDAMREGQLKRTSGRVITENEVYFGSHYGRDVVLEYGQSTHWIRAIMVEQRLFVIVVQTKGNYATQAAALKTANAARAKKFFDSFAVTNIPAPATSAVDLPEDFGTTVANSAFSSAFLGVSFDLPKGWTVLDSDQNQLLLEMGKEDISKTRPMLAEHMTHSNARILLSVSKTPIETSVNNAILVVGVERASYPNFLALSAAKTSVTTFVDKSKTLVIEPKLQTIGGIEFAWFELSDSLSKLSQRMYYANRKGMVFEIVLTYTDQKDLQHMLRSVESLKTK